MKMTVTVTKTKEVNVRECPFCGKDEYLTLHQDIEEYFYVWCDNCYIGGKKEHSELDAVKSWNQRGGEMLAE